MTDTRDARAKAIGRIHQLLAGVAEPHRFQVEPGRLMRMPGDRAIVYWFEGESEKAFTIGGNVMATHQINIRAFWRIPATDDERARSAVELEIWSTTRGIQAALQGDSDLAASVTRLDIGMAQRGYDEVQVGNGVEAVGVFTLDIPLFLQELEAEGKAA